jgi:hypothetical protein
MARRLLLGLIAATLIAAAPATPTRLFSDSAPLRVTIQGPVSLVVRRASSSRDPHRATLAMANPAESHTIMLSARGKSRRTLGFCQFPPLSVEFVPKPAATSLFERQGRLKLVTHCRSSAGHQQHVLLEYAAYLLFNRISPAGLRARLATVDYVNEDGRPLTSRTGFFTEDPDDAARRNGMREVEVPGSVPARSLDAMAAARAALFEYMIGNLDWSMRSGEAGVCCHNFKMLAAAGASSGMVPVPYDFDFSGFVGTDYAVPPEGVPVRSVRQRRYRGYCIHNAQAVSVAAEFRAKRGELIAVLGQVPGLEERTRRRAASYLEEFFEDIATDEGVRKLVRTCIS